MRSCCLSLSDEADDDDINALDDEDVGDDEAQEDSEEVDDVDAGDDDAEIDSLPCVVELANCAEMARM
jgi:hypothetical protein